MSSKIIIGETARGSRVAVDLDVLLRTRMLVQANSGGGKSWVLRRLAEQLFGKIQVIIIDPEGEFATLREKYGFVLIGKGGETPADPRSAEMVAHKLLELRASAVCDLFEMKSSDRHRFVRFFLDALIDAPKKFWHPVVIIVDECATFCPEKGAGESEASDAMISLATRGRKRGFGSVWATQRLNNLRKDAAAQLMNVLIGPTWIDVDRKRAADILGVPRDEQKRFFDQMKMLDPGKFFALGRAVSKDRILVEIGPVETTHPELGSAKHAAAPPPAPSKVRQLLPQLADLPKAAEEEARTAAEFRRQIRELRVQLRSAQAQAPVVRDPKRLAAAEAELAAMKRSHASLAGTLKDMQRAATWTRSELEKATSAIAKASDGLARANKAATEPSAVRGMTVDQFKNQFKQPQLKGKHYDSLIPDVARASETPVPQARMAPASVSENGTKLRAGARRLLAALVQWSPNGMQYGQMRAHAGLKKSGTFSAYMRDLRVGGLIEERQGMVFATDAGLGAIGDLPPAPQTTAEVLEVWNPKLREGARRMLAELVTLSGETISREELQQRTRLSNSGTFSAYLRDLKTARLIELGSGGVAASRETLLL